jgi:cytochrome c oxidase subunit 2
MEAPLNYFFHSAGPQAAPTMVLGWIFTAIVCVVCLIILVLLLIALFHKRPRTDIREISRGQGGIRWVIGGTAFSALVLFGMALYALVALEQVSRVPPHAAVTIDVTGYDWWWRVRYLSADGATVFETANEIHIPVGLPVLMKLDSADVIHAFWVPQLAGKTQMIPGSTNTQWLEAETPGVYRGQCTQYCGVQHAHMAFEVIAEAPAAFAAWVQHQQRPASLAAISATPARAADIATTLGWKVFSDRCAACHTIDGTPAHGMHGPNLTHLASRRQIAAGLLDNTPQNRENWIAHAQTLKIGSLMPDSRLSRSQMDDLNALLATLD